MREFPILNLSNEAWEVFETVFKTHYKLLCAHAHSFLNDTTAAEDAVQQAFVSTMQNYQHVHSNTTTYIYRSVYRNCLNIIELRKRRMSFEVLNQINKKTADYPDIDLMVLEKQSLLRELHIAIRQLPHQRQEAMRLVYIEKRRYDEAALLMGISKNSIKTHLKKG